MSQPARFAGLGVLMVTWTLLSCGEGDPPLSDTVDGGIPDGTLVSPEPPSPAAPAAPAAKVVDDPLPSMGSAEELLGGLGNLLGALGGSRSEPEPWPLTAPPDGWRADAAPAVPLVPGLTVSTAVEDVVGDFESVKRVLSVDEEAVEILFETSGYDDGGEGGFGVRRTVLQADLRDAHRYRMLYGSDDKPRYPGWTALGVSAAQLRELRREGTTPLEVFAPGDILGTFLAAAGVETPLVGVLERVDDGEPVPVLLNGERVWLPVVHARGPLRGTLDDIQADFWFLDDPDNPLTLRAAIGKTRLQAVRLDFAAADARSAMEAALVESGSVELSGIYFASGSAKILPTSDIVLDQVAAMLKDHPDWAMEVGGHTDAVGPTEDNEILSRQRADAVIDALAARTGEDVRTRLRATGYGETQPVESNDTLEGRARNRRVELTRLGS